MMRLNRLSRISDKSGHESIAPEPELVASKINNPVPQRQLSLLALTIVLNTLLWSSILAFIIALFQIASDSSDKSNILPGVLTLVSAIVTISHAIVHTTYSVKQRALTYQQLDPSVIKKTTYIANRLVVSLCVLWLLTAGWNMILVARRPVCLPNQLDGQNWETGITCLVSRIGMAFAMIALVASLTLFGLMAAVRRPFEAHLFAYGQREPNTTDITPPSRRSSEDRSATEKLVPEIGAFDYNYERSNSLFTNADVETLDLNASSRSSSIMQSPSPTYDRLEVFTSPFAPPPLPPAFMVSMEPSLKSRTIASDPFAHRRRLSLAPRTDALLAPAAYAPYSIPIEFSASAQRAVHPDGTPRYRTISTSRSQPHLRSISSYSNRLHSSRSSVSLSRPQRVSSLTPVPHFDCSSRSETLISSGGTSEPGDSPNSKSVASSTEKKNSMAEVVYNFANNTPSPSTDKLRSRKHGRTVSAPDAVARSRQPQLGERMAIGWKPLLSKSSTGLKKSLPINLNKLKWSASAELLSRFGPVAASDAADMQWKKDFEIEIENRLNDLHVLPLPSERKSMSSDADTLRQSYDAGSLEDEMRFEDAKEILSMRPASLEIAFI